MTVEAQPSFAEWVVLELLGHRRLAGWLTEQQVAGASFLRLDIPGSSEADRGATQLYAPGSVYAITPTTEDVARRVAARCRPAPVQRWELPAAPTVRMCRVCGCTDDAACEDGCHWTGDDLCSTCAPIGRCDECPRPAILTDEGVPYCRLHTGDPPADS